MKDGELCILFREQHDEYAFEILIKRHLGFCYDQAIKKGGDRVSVEDLVAEGERGLYEAALRFDPGGGTKFLSFAGKYVAGNMYKRIKEDSVWENELADLEEADKETDWIQHADSRSDLFRSLVSVEERVIRKAYSKEIKESICHLSERERRILLEKFFDPPVLWALIYPGKEISDEILAEYFGMPLRLLKKNLHDAYDKLRKELDPAITDRIHKNECNTICRERGAFIDKDFWIIRK